MAVFRYFYGNPIYAITESNECRPPCKTLYRFHLAMNDIRRLSLLDTVKKYFNIPPIFWMEIIQCRLKFI